MPAAEQDMTTVDDAINCIEVEDLSKVYKTGTRQVQALKGVSMRIDEPGFYAIMGESGSGKSTLLHLLGGLDKPDGGRIVVNGTRIDSATESELTTFRRRRIGIVFQQFNLLPTLDALDNVILPGVLDRQPRDEMTARGVQLLEELGLGDRIHHRPDALSGGEQQRVAIARSLLFEPGILLADEPTGNLDSTSSQKLWRLLDELADRKRMIVIMVTHEAAAAVHCRSVMVMRDGTIAGTLQVDQTDASELVHRAAELSRPS